MNPQPLDDHSLRSPAWSDIVAMLVDHDRLARHADPRTALEAEAKMWATPLGGHPAGLPMAWWAGWWAIQRPMQVDAMQRGYGIPGVEVLAAVNEVSEEAGTNPRVVYGAYDSTLDEAPQVRVRYEWDGFESLIFLRAPALRSPTHPVFLSVDLWQQLDPLEDTSKDAGPAMQVELATWRPGQFHDGTPRSIQDPELRRMEEDFHRAIENPAPSTPPPPTAPAWVDPKMVAHKDEAGSSAVLEVAAAPPPPRCPVCQAENITPVRFGRCSDCQRLIEAGNVWGLPQPPEGMELKALGQDVYWARVKAVKEAKQRRHELGLKPAEKMLEAADKAEAKTMPDPVAEPSAYEDAVREDIQAAVAMVTVRCTVCNENMGLMPMSEARKDAPKGCKKCGADASAIEVKSTSTGVVVTGQVLGGIPDDPQPAAKAEPAKKTKSKRSKKGGAS
jgi:hypothetical protein